MCAWCSNWCIYLDNLSFSYLFSVILSFFAVFLSWWIYRTDTFQIYCDRNKTEKINPVNWLCQHTLENAVDGDIKCNFTKEELEAEREIEKVQLATIFRLLSEHHDKFQVDSMEDLECQLRLYRR